MRKVIQIAVSEQVYALCDDGTVWSLHHRNASEWKKLVDIPQNDAYLSMKRKLDAGEAIDISECPREGEYYILKEATERKDYFDLRNEIVIWSIGRRRRDGVILASAKRDLYDNPDFECLWLR
jgi:hypothetical protein